MRTPHRSIILASGLLLFWLGLVPVARATWPHDPTVNVPVCVHGYLKQNLVACSDGAGGIIMAWVDGRSGTWRIYASRILADGTLAPGWTANGTQVATVTTTRTEDAPVICSDGAGGAYVAWNEYYSGTDLDVYAQHITAAGVLSWGANGAVVCGYTDYEDYPSVAPDGVGGVFIAWQDHRNAANYHIYAQHLTSAAALASGAWVSGGLLVCNATGDQTSPAIAPDGTGGIDIAWYDGRNSPASSIYAQRASGAGALMWTANGIVIAQGSYSITGLNVVTNSFGGGVYAWIDYRAGSSSPGVYCTGVGPTGLVVGALGGKLISPTTGSRSDLALIPDNAGGAYAGWTDYRNSPAYQTYLQRVRGTGEIAAGWPDASSDLLACTAAGNRAGAALVADGTNGVLVAWTDTRTGIRNDDYAAHFTATGAVAEGWDVVNANPVTTADMSQWLPAGVTDGNGGAVFAWRDERNGTLSAYDIYCQRIDRWGALGNAEPSIARVRDVPNDQGGHVKLSWNASYLDAYPGYAISSYLIWRQTPGTVAETALRRGARLLAAGEAPGDGATRSFRVTSLAGVNTYWEYVTGQTANGFTSYSLVVPTTSDSIAGSNPYTTFMVEARGWGDVRWDSAPDSGYSADNLPPIAPAPFTGNYVKGTGTILTWGPNSESDLAGYRLYKGTFAAFTPGPGNRIAEIPGATSTIDPTNVTGWYKLAAFDVHGNESAATTLLPAGTTGVDDALPRTLSFTLASGNPVRGAAALRLALPAAADSRVAIYDATGREVRVLWSGALPAGVHTLRWDDADARGQAVASGLYFARLLLPERTLVQRLVVTR